MKCSAKCQVFSRVVGYFSPVAQWNLGKKAEWNERKTYLVPKLEPIKKGIAA
jgi:ribonucleoside-triphosphate reductase